MHLLLIEDDRRLAGYTAEFLQQNGFAVAVAGSAAEALAELRRQPPQVILLDLGLPGMDGLELARTVRLTSAVPIIVVTARDRIDDRIAGLDLGADDYLGKPYDPRELLARIRAVLRRGTGSAPAPGTQELGEGLEVRFGPREVWRQGERLELTSQEFALIAALARHLGTVLSREALLEALRGADSDEVFDRSIDVIVSRVRQKIEVDPRQPRYLKTVRGQGYLLTSLA